MDDETQYTQLDVLCLKALEIGLSTTKIMDDMMPGSGMDTYRMIMQESIIVIMNTLHVSQAEVVSCLIKWVDATSPKNDPNATTAV